MGSKSLASLLIRGVGLSAWFGAEPCDQTLVEVQRAERCLYVKSAGSLTLLCPRSGCRGAGERFSPFLRPPAAREGEGRDRR